MDTLSASERSKRMSLVRGRDTGPELVVRRRLHALGYRYRLHARELPGKPDLVFPSRRAVVFVHGCFWHRHPDPTCKLARLPKSRLDFWLPKLETNRERDNRNVAALEGLGWRVFIAWECEVARIDSLLPRLTMFLNE
ncbi:MAG: DNA mismatch endonuclease Vsr [Hyphomonadaceae bacterium]